MIREADPRVKLYLESPSWPDPELSDRLDYGKPDNEIVGCLHRFAKENPNADARLLTHDAGPMMTARGLGLCIAPIKEEWVQPPESSEEEREIARLNAEIVELNKRDPQFNAIFPILGVFRLNGQSKRDDGMIFGYCKASQSPVYPIRDAILAVNHASCPSLSSSGPRQWGESALKTSRLPGALSLLARSWLYPPSAWQRR